LTDKNKFLTSSHNSYSQALYELAEESKILGQIEDQASAVIKLITENKDFTSIIKNPTLKQEDLINIINLISEKFSFNELFKKFINFLIFKRRLFYIENILKDFVSICSINRGEILAKLTVAKELDKLQIEKIKSELSQNFGSNIKLHYKHDQDIIGGLIIQVGSVMIDTSIKNKLHKIRNKLIEA